MKYSLFILALISFLFLGSESLIFELSAKYALGVYLVFVVQEYFTDVEIKKMQDRYNAENK